MAAIRDARSHSMSARAFWIIAMISTLLLPASASPSSCPYTIDTFVGGSTPEGVDALEVNLYPHGVAFHDGELFIMTDGWLRRVSTDGNIRTVAGVGQVPGPELDGGDARQAGLPGSDIAIDGQGRVFVACRDRYCVRRVDPDGTIHTVAGVWGVRGSPGDGEGLVATDVSFFQVQSIGLGPDGTLYIVTFSQVRRVLPDGTLHTVAGVPAVGIVGSGDGGAAAEAVFADPSDVAVVADGSVYIADSADHRVRVVGTDGVIRAFAGVGGVGWGDTGDGGPATDAEIGSPESILVDGDGSLLIGDARNGKIRRVDGDGIITSIAGTGTTGFGGDGGPALEAMLENGSLKMTRAPDGTLYIADRENYRVRSVSPSSVIETVAGNGWKLFAGDGGPAGQASVHSPYDVTRLPDGSLLVADTTNNRIRRVSPDGTMETWAGTGEHVIGGHGGPAELAGVIPFALDAVEDGRVYLIETGPIQTFLSTSGTIVRMIDSDGRIHWLAGTGNSGFSGDGGPAREAELDHPADLAVTADGSVYIADSGNNRIRRIDPSGIIDTIAGTGESWVSNGDGGPAVDAAVDAPSDVALDGLGNIYIAENGGEKIRMIDSDGIIHTVAGTGTRGFSGDGGPATSAELAGPSAIAIDDRGRLLIVDSSNYRIRRVDTDGTMDTIAGNGDFGFNGDGQCALDAALGYPVDILPVGSRILIAGGYHLDRVRVLEPNDDVPVGFSTLRGWRKDRGVVLRWEAHGSGRLRYVVERNQGAGFEAIAEWDSDGSGEQEYVDATAPPDAETDYRVRVETGGRLLTVLGPVHLDGRPLSGPGLRAWPNPLRSSGEIHFTLERAGPVTLDVYDSRGRRVRRLLAGRAGPGALRVGWDGTDGRGHAVASGTYFVVLEDARGRRSQHKLVVLR